MAALSGVAPTRAGADVKALTPEIFSRTGKRRKILPSSASRSGSSHTLWQMDRTFRFYCSASGRWEVADEVAFDERLGTFQSAREYSKAVKPRYGVKRNFNPWPQLGVTAVQYDKLCYTDAWHSPAAAFTPSDRRLAQPVDYDESTSMVAQGGQKRPREDWDDARSVVSADSRYSKGPSVYGGRSVRGARTIGGQMSEMFAQSAADGTSVHQDDRTTLYGESNSMFDATERARTEGTGTEAATEKGSVMDTRSRAEDATEMGSVYDTTEKGSVAGEEASVADGWDQRSQVGEADPVSHVLSLLPGGISRDTVAAAVAEYQGMSAIPRRGTGAYSKWLTEWHKRYGFKPDLLLKALPKEL
eukprot:TRINITY_DN9398_c2_g1_i1.p1 TRINITY_DN9398_c2_g1~~TRINITY_DN9398_c2_g1_i1.p1  ORF type:complete len:384 (+),score=107.77 TRINITY_DN9398_c2_g1_i1:78-1154(+)